MGPDKVEKLCQRARQAIADRDWDKAKQSYLLALGYRSDNPDVHYGLATVYFQVGEYTSAAHHFREVTRLDPKRAGAYINLGAVLNVLENYDAAIAELRRGIELDPNRVEGFYNLGLVYKRKGQVDLAITAYKETIRLNPRMGDAHYNLANLLVDREQPRQALSHYEKALEIRPNWEKARVGLQRCQDLLSGKTPPPPSSAPPVSPGFTPRIPTAPAAHSDMDRMMDPVIHGAFLSNLHHATIVCEETGKLIQKILLEEVETSIKDLSTALLHTHGSRGELDASLSRFENAINRMKSAHEANKVAISRIEEIGERFPTK